MNISGEDLEALRRKLAFKVRYALGSWSADVEDIVQETIVRLLRTAHDGGIRSAANWGAFAAAVCSNVIHEHRRKYWREVDEQLANPNSSTESHAARIEANEVVQRILAQLLPRDQQLLRRSILKRSPWKRSARKPV